MVSDRQHKIDVIGPNEPADWAEDWNRPQRTPKNPSDTDKIRRNVTFIRHEMKNLL